MTAATLSRLPLAGGTLVGSMGRGGGWLLVKLIDGGFWTVAQFMRAPVAITAVAAVAGFSVLAGSNALYFQTGRHPAPLLFGGSHPAVSVPVVRPVVPAPRPHLPSPAIDSETTGSVGPQPASEVIGSAEILALQQKLVALALLDAAPDGHFGRRTAAAIRAFETKVGMKVDGRPTRDVLAAVAAAPAAAGALPITDSQSPAATVAGARLTTSTQLARPVAVAQSAAPIPLAPAPKPVVAVPEAAASVPAGQGTVAAADSFAANSTDVATAVTDSSVAPGAPAAATSPAATAGSAAREDLTAGSSSVAMAAAPTAIPAAGRVVASASTDNSTAPAAPADPSLTAAQKLAAEIGTLPPGATTANAVAPATAAEDDSDGSTDPVLITKIQRALASLGFLAAKIDGVPGEGTAKAIRNFEVFYDYKITGLATHELLDLLIQHGAVI